MTKKEQVMAAIESLGYKPKIDEEGDVFVRYQMKNIYMMMNDNEEAYLAVLLPQFAEIEEGEETLALATCNKMTRDAKFVKVFIDSTFKNITASCEFYYTDDECLKTCIERALALLGMVRSYFYKTKEDLAK